MDKEVKENSEIVVNHLRAERNTNALYGGALISMGLLSLAYGFKLSEIKAKSPQGEFSELLEPVFYLLIGILLLTIASRDFTRAFRMHREISRLTGNSATIIE